MELASLGIEAKTTGVDQATSKLDKLTGAAKRVETAAGSLTGATEKAAASMGLWTDKAGRLRNAMGQFASAQEKAAAAALAAAGALDAESAAALKAAGAVNKLNGAANDNKRHMSAASMNVGNLAAQFQDIGVSAAMSMNPLQIALQQGTQISAVLGPMGASGAVRALGEAFLSVISPVSLATIAIVALAAAGLQMVNWSKLAASALTMLANGLVVIAPYAAAAAAGLALLYAPAIIGGVIGLIALLGRLSVAAIGAAASMAAANPAGALVLGMVAAVAAANVFRDELTQIFGVDIVGSAKDGANLVIGAFVAAFHDLEFLWAQFPDVIGAAAIGAANMAIKAVNAIVSASVNAINGLIRSVQTVFKTGAAVGTGMDVEKILGNTSGLSNFIEAPQLDEIANEAAGRLAGAVRQRNKTLQDDLTADYLGTIGTAVTKGASAASTKLKELAKDLTTVDDKSKKKGGGGKTEAEKYSDIVDGANRRIASLKAEQEALGMTEQSAAALKYETDLLNQAQQKGIELTAAQKAELSGLAQQMAATEIATKQAKEALDFVKDATKGFLSDLRSGLANGEGLWQSFGKAALNVLDKIISKVEDELVNALFSAGNASSGGGGGGLLGGLLGGIGKIFGFRSGGYTGSGATGRAAGIVHGQEYVFNARATKKIGIGNLERIHSAANGNGYQSGGYVTPMQPAPQNGGVIVVRTINEVRNGNLVPVMTEVAGEVSGQKIKEASPQIVAASVTRANETAPAAMAKYQRDTAGGDYRTS
ncbi:phage tail length tape measure family protein [Ensifer sp. ENS07]|uniref:phage tail length tape measure family protein n=1 Tax=Ensifer sp. ENS07 TaxID=2769274 RepID=UPI00178534F1|nr:phage tail length tape measure family protein [Ensifer sp. ENS07]MBD9635477.1 phage tail length tape measure family protein [Ensifer sp. ENS07]